MQKIDLENMVAESAKSKWFWQSEPPAIAQIKKMLTEYPLNALDSSATLPSTIILALKKMAEETQSNPIPNLSAALNSHQSEKSESDSETNEPIAKQVLQHVMQGDPYEAENCLQSEDEFPFAEKVTFTDPGGRTFTTTPVQYAVWAGDWPMLNMLMHYIPRKEVEEQVKELETLGLEDHGTQFDLEPLLNAYREYTNYFIDFEFEINFKPQDVDVKKIESLWNTLMHEQKKLPLHMLQQFCNSQADKLNEPFNRLITVYYKNKPLDITDPNATKKLGVDYCLIRQTRLARPAEFDPQLKNYEILGPISMTLDLTLFEKIAETSRSQIEKTLGHPLALKPKYEKTVIQPIVESVDDEVNSFIHISKK